VSSVSDRSPAGFASRAVAFLTDAVVFGVSHALISWTTVQVAALLARPSFGERLAPWIVTIGGIVFAIGYNVVSWAWFGRTPGKALLGLIVTTENGARPGVFRSLARFGGYLLSAIPLGAGFLWILVDDHRRAWHDHLVGTRVVYLHGARVTGRRAAEVVPVAPASG
jgi:uncharacterized RDD family membrane protein YckC